MSYERNRESLNEAGIVGTADEDRPASPNAKVGTPRCPAVGSIRFLTFLGRRSDSRLNSLQPRRLCNCLTGLCI